MGQGLRRKECQNDILHLGLELSDDLDFCMHYYGLQKLDKAAKFLGKAENKV